MAPLRDAEPPCIMTELPRRINRYRQKVQTNLETPAQAPGLTPHQPPTRSTRHTVTPAPT